MFAQDLKVNFVENRVSKLFGADFVALQVGYLSHSRNICLVGEEKILVLDLTHEMESVGRKREIVLRNRIGVVCFHPLFCWLVAIGFGTELVLFDLRFDHPLLGRHSAFAVDFLSFSGDGLILLSGSKSGLVAKHKLKVMDSKEAIVWKGKEL